MKILLYFLFLTLVSCGGGGGTGTQKSNIVGNDPNLPSNPGTGIVSDTLVKFKDAVNRNQWGQHQFFSHLILDMNLYMLTLKQDKTVKVVLLSYALILEWAPLNQLTLQNSKADR